ncbi:MAG: DUF1189 family protein [Candidatus Omnitrophota bacterium]
MFGMFGAFDPKFYPKIAKQSTGKSIGFLTVFVLIIAAVVSVRYTFFVHSGFNSAKKWADQNLATIASEYPVVSVEKGMIMEPKQTFIKEYGEQFTVVIEPDQDNVRAHMDKYHNLALLTQKQLIFKQVKDNSGAEEIKTYPMEKASFSITPGVSGFKLLFEQKPFELTAKIISRLLDIAGLFVFPVLLILWFFVYLFTKPLHVFIFSLVSLIITAILKVKLPYKELWNIGAYALVPATCLAAFMDITGLRVLFFPLFYCLAYSVYLYLGIKAVKQARETVSK